MLILQGVAYTHPDKEILFRAIDLVINKHDKVALIGNNGAGKSTLLKILAGVLKPSAGIINTIAPYYVPQHFGQYNSYTVAQALQVDVKLNALHAIENGVVNDDNFTLLDEDWTIQERCAEALRHWGLSDIDLQQNMDTLSGGQKTRVFLAGIQVHHPGVVLLDEPTNHMDLDGRELLYRYLQTTNDTVVVVSHDRKLLNLLHKMLELDKQGITAYGGNYDFYKEHKDIALLAQGEELKNKEKALRKARETERETMERQQKLDARGKKKQEQSGLPTIAMNTLRNQAEKSTAKTKNIHAEKVNGLSDELARLRKELPDKDKMKIAFDNSHLHKGKILVEAKDINLAYGDRELWQQPLSFILKSGDRIAIKGNNGSGKTTLIRLILGYVQPTVGTIELSAFHAVYIDQDYSLIHNNISVYSQAQLYNNSKLAEHEIKSRLTHFLFTAEYWDKPCGTLSGGEKMRLMLCCLTIDKQAPDIIVLDEPNNNLDVQNIEILTAAISAYRGTVIAVSHDEYFLQQIGALDELSV